jgi:nucleoside-diphosphate-sugar epimerase
VSNLREERTALIIGGTGPSGPAVAAGLQDRGYKVSILHSGQHEVDFAKPVEHIHGDVHFEETLEQCLVGRHFDTVVAAYGRLRLSAKVLIGKTERVFAVTGFTGYPSADQEIWGAFRRPPMLGDDGPWIDDSDSDKFSRAVHKGEEALFTSADAGCYEATIVRPPIVYGPMAPSPQDWSIVRRIRDGRRQFIIPDGGLKIEGRLAASNLARAILGVVDNPQMANGKRYNLRDKELYTMRQRIAYIGSVMGAELELISTPFAYARPSHPLWRYVPGHNIPDDTKFREEIACTDAESTAEAAIAETVRWLLSEEHHIDETEYQLGDPFDYGGEDRIISVMRQSANDLAKCSYELPAPAHPYRHPKSPNEEWAPPASADFMRHFEALTAEK